ncbi:hypothetical protein ACTHAM_002375 [Cellulomonas soli]|uniref:hypothetical protein n=1 Tax=Cellulomonas soli TaxID=931535 RepID=UPI003F857437
MSKLNRAGRYRHAPAADAAARVTGWLERGWEAAAIASAAGLSVATVHGVIRAVRAGTADRMAWATVRALLAAGDPTTGLVGALSTRRRLEALATLGWDPDAIAAAADVAAQPLWRVRRGQQPKVQARTWARVRAAYRDLATTPGPSPVVAAHALAAGWEPPVAWDEDTIEDPTELDLDLDDTVDEVVIVRALAGEHLATTRAERLHLVPLLHAEGLTDAQVGDRLGVCAETVMRTRKVLGIGGRYEMAAEVAA